MMKPLYKQPLLEAVILASGILCTVVLVHGIQNFIALGGKPVTSQVAQKSNSDLVQVAAGNEAGNNPNCPAGLGQTAGSYFDKTNEKDPFNDFFGKIFPSATAVSGTVSLRDYPDSLDLPSTHNQGGLKFAGLFPSVESVTLKELWNAPSNFKNLEFCGSGAKKPTSELCQKEIGSFEVPVGTPVKVPSSSYRLLNGTNITGMIMYADANSLRLSFARQDMPGSTSSMAYQTFNLYIGNITVDPGILAKYRQGNDETNRTCMPEVSVGDTLGTAMAGGVRLAFRDSGNLQPMDDAGWWTGKATGGVGPGGGGGNPAPPPPSDKLGLGQQCTDDVKCVSGNCIAVMGSPVRFCKQGTLVQNAVCTHQSQCKSDTCTDGKCAAKDPAALPTTISSSPAAAKTFTVSGNISTVGSKPSSSKYRVHLQQDGNHKYTSDFVDSRYSIPNVIPGEYNIFTQLTDPPGVTALVGTNPTPIIVESNVTRDFSIAYNSSPPPPSTAPTWVLNQEYCYDNTKQSYCSEGKEDLFAGGRIYCKKFGAEIRPLEETKDFNTTCNYKGRAYLTGTKGNRVNKGPNDNVGVPFCQYFASDDGQGTRWVDCRYNQAVCDAMCNITSQDIKVSFQIQNATGYNDADVNVNNLTFSFGGTDYRGTQSNTQKYLYTLSIPSTSIKANIKRDNTSENAITITVTIRGVTRTLVPRDLQWPTNNPATFVVNIRG